MHSIQVLSLLNFSSVSFTFLWNSFQDRFAHGLSFPHLLLSIHEGYTCFSNQLVSTHWSQHWFESLLYKGLPFCQLTVQYWLCSWLGRSSLGFYTRSHPTHINSLQTGRVCNIAKTELMTMNCDLQISIEIDQKTIASSKSMKVLGLTLDNELDWTLQADNCVAKSSRMLHDNNYNNNLVEYRLTTMLMRDQHLFRSPAIEIHGYCRLLQPWLRVPCWFFCNLGLKNFWHGPRIEPTTIDPTFQSGAHDLSATATL